LGWLSVYFSPAEIKGNSVKKHRFYCPQIEGQQAVLDAAQTHHLAHVLRLGPPDQVELFDGKGKIAQAVIRSISKKAAFLDIQEYQTFPPPALRIIIAASMAKSKRFDLLIEKCTEIGADHIAAVQFERTVKMGKETSLDRYEKISISAAKQSGRLFLPVLSGPDSFDNTTIKLQNNYPKALWIYGENESSSNPVRSMLSDRMASSPEVIAVIGPEGGMTETEKKVLQDLGALDLCLSPNVLRVETAAIAFCAVLSAFRL
jgi:16S rRNA (uracil1498-N3)-methyltransferase